MVPPIEGIHVFSDVNNHACITSVLVVTTPSHSVPPHPPVVCKSFEYSFHPRDGFTHTSHVTKIYRRCFLWIVGISWYTPLWRTVKEDCVPVKSLSGWLRYLRSKSPFEEKYLRKVEDNDKTADVRIFVFSGDITLSLRYATQHSISLV